MTGTDKTGTDKTISATDLRAKCFKILDELKPEGIIITKRRRPVARLTPIPPPVRTVDNSRFFGCMKGKVKIQGNIFSTGVKWEAKA